MVQDRVRIVDDQFVVILSRHKLKMVKTHILQVS